MQKKKIPYYLFLKKAAFNLLKKYVSKILVYIYIYIYIYTKKIFVK